MTTCNLFLFFLVALATVTCATAACPITALEDSTCPWRRVAYVNDPYIQGYGSWALESTTLAFEKVESATAQALGDCCNNIKRNYALIIDATQRPGGAVNKYKAVVYVYESIPITLISLESVDRHPLAN